jgi:hypothetical protein
MLTLYHRELNHMKPTGYIEFDNDTTVSINQVRNDGRLDYSITVKTDINKHIDGKNLIDCIIFQELDPLTAFDPITEAEFFGDNLFTGYVP